MSNSGLETLTLTPSEIFNSLRALMGTDLTAFVWGPPGIAKSQVVQQLAASECMDFFDTRLSQMDPTDLRGIPYPVTSHNETGVRWSVPLALPRDLKFDVISEIEAEPTILHFTNPSNAVPTFDVQAIGKNRLAEIVSKSVTRNRTFADKDGVVHPDAFEVRIIDTMTGETVAGKVHWKITGKVRGILALEEFNSAPQSVQAAAYQLLLDRKLGEYEVPEGVLIVALGNRDTDKGVTYKMPTPIMNRLVHMEMRVSFDDWLVWALNNRVHADIVGYLTAFKESLFDFKPGSAARGFPTPRSWDFASRILKNSPDVSEQIMRALIIGCVGDADGQKFMSFRKIASSLPRAEDILSGKLLKLPNKVEVQLAYALVTTLCYELKEQANTIRRDNPTDWKKSPERKIWLQRADNFMLFMVDNFQPEICIMGGRMAIHIHMLPFETTKMKHFDTFAERYKGMLVPSNN